MGVLDICLRVHLNIMHFFFFLIVKLCVSNIGNIAFQAATFNIQPLLIVNICGGLVGMNHNCLQIFGS